MKRTVTIEISGLEHSLRRFAKAWRTGRRAGKVISFESPEVLFRRITPKRWTLLTVLQSSGPLSVRELTRQVQRNVKNVHGDVQALIEIGLIERRGSTVRVPFDEIRTAFRLTRAA
ncbi:MAG: winged helix-turn-helix domain-containing protein [Deltaproteobacteria bacterium]|nr:winged helix-turn-helix domain-containing protein [Deltaproteobacteria bacterium]